MRDVDRFASQLRKARNTPDYWTELSKQEFAEGVRAVMGSMKQSVLAEKLGNVSESFVSQILSGQYNFTLSKMNEIAHALDAAVHVHVVPRSSLVTLREIPIEEQEKRPVVGEDTGGSSDDPVVGRVGDNLYDMRRSVAV